MAAAASDTPAGFYPDQGHPHGEHRPGIGSFVLASPGTVPEAPTVLETAARKVVQAFDEWGARSKPAPLAAAVGELRDALGGAGTQAGGQGTAPARRAPS